MTAEEYRNEIKLLKDKVDKLTEEYINSNKIYNIGDILKVSFHTNTGLKVCYCKLMNIHTLPDNVFASLYHWPTSNIVYFARYCYVDEKNTIQVGDVCHLGYLSYSNLVCGYAGVDIDTLKIKVIKPTTFKRQWKLRQKEII